MKKIITLNGRDGIGKTEQVRLLRSLPELHVTRALKEYGDKWPKLNGSDEFRWWFEQVSFDEFLYVITDSLNKRHLDVSPEKVTVHERGTRMFLAVCMATLATRLQKSVSEVQEEVQRQFLSRLNYQPEVESDILLVENSAYGNYIKKLNSQTVASQCSYTSEQREIYDHYQRHLRVVVQTCLGGADTVEVDQPIVDIQNRVRKAISSLTGVELENLCEHIQCLFCLGGMSESGKSMLGQNLHTMYGSYRLKLKYFSSGKFGDDSALAQEVLKFLHMHRHIAFASVESLHNLGLPIVFKKLLGNRAKVIFLDAPQEERAKRHMELPGAEMAEFLQKDALKERRGALRVKTVADLVIDTSIGSPEVTCEKVFKYK